VNVSPNQWFSTFFKQLRPILQFNSTCQPPSEIFHSDTGNAAVLAQWKITVTIK